MRRNKDDDYHDDDNDDDEQWWWWRRWWLRREVMMMKMKRREGGRGEDTIQTKQKRVARGQRTKSNTFQTRWQAGGFGVNCKSPSPGTPLQIHAASQTLPVQSLYLYHLPSSFSSINGQHVFLFSFFIFGRKESMRSNVWWWICGHNMSQYDIVRYRYQRHFGAGWSAVQRKDCR